MSKEMSTAAEITARSRTFVLRKCAVDANMFISTRISIIVMKLPLMSNINFKPVKCKKGIIRQKTGGILMPAGIMT